VATALDHKTIALDRHPRVRMYHAGIDPWLLVPVLALLCLGVIMIYSSSIVDAYQYYHSPYYFLKRELLWVAVGLGAMAVSARLHYSVWKRVAGWLLLTTIGLLILVLVPHFGHSSHGAQRWFQFGGWLSFQPSELAKLSLAIYMAHWLSAKGSKLRDFKRCSMPFGIIVGIVCLLIMKQPDMGTAIVVALSMLTIYFVAGARLDHFLYGILGSLALAIPVLHLEAYRNARLSAWLDPWKDPTGAGYHTIQALLALGLGGVTGVGLGNSQQKYYLPAPYTDSIFAITAEELGLLGALLIILLFVIFAYRGLTLSRYAPDNFGKLLAVGLTTGITLQALLNIAVITASVPFTGVPLPFVSFGGSSLVISMLSVGILLSISRHANKPSSALNENGEAD
jgi:cell division protein FtsW